MSATRFKLNTPAPLVKEQIENINPGVGQSRLPSIQAQFPVDASQCASMSMELAPRCNVLLWSRENNFLLAGDNNDLSNGGSVFCWNGGCWGRGRPIGHAVERKTGNELYDIVGSNFGKRRGKDIELHGDGKKCDPA